MSRKTLYWTLQTCGWGLQGSLNLLFLWMFDPRSASHAAIVFGSCSASGILLSHGLRNLIRRRDWLKMPLSRSFGRYLLAGLAFGALQTGWAAIGYRLLLNPKTFQQFGWVPPALSIWTITFVLWISIYTSIVQLRRAQQAEQQRLELDFLSRDAQFKALLSQVNPHFLFNSLNSLRALIFEDSHKAARMIDELAGLLRYSLQSGEKRTVNLGEELQAVNQYFAIEKIRFEERLQVDMRIGLGVEEAVVPPMLLQTLAENAVKHGIERREKGGTVSIAACLRNGSLHLTVANSGAIGNNSTSTRIGLQNADQRLQLLFGSAARLSITEKDGTVFAEVEIPQEVPLASAHRR